MINQTHQLSHTQKRVSVLVFDLYSCMIKCERMSLCIFVRKMLCIMLFFYAFCGLILGGDSNDVFF